MARDPDPYLPTAGKPRHRSGGYPVPRLGPMDNPGHAQWCDSHEKLECTKIRPGVRIRCHGPAVRGTNACPRHSGTSKQVAIIRGEAQISAWSAMGTPKSGEHVDPGMAVLSMLQMSWMRVAIYGDLLRRQVEGQKRIMIEDAIAEREWSGAGNDGDPIEIEAADAAMAGLVGHKYAAAGAEGTIYRASEEVRALVTLEAQERDRCVSYAAQAHKMGISERLTSLAESWGDVVAGRVADLLADLNLTPEQQKRVPELITRYLSAIEMGGMGSMGGGRS